LFATADGTTGIVTPAPAPLSLFPGIAKSTTISQNILKKLAG